MKTRRIRLQEEQKTKLKWPTLVLTIILWVFNVLIIYFIEPETLGAIPLFFVLVFISSFLTFSVIFKNKIQGAIIAGSIILFLLLRFFGIGNILNLLLIVGIVAAIEIYLHSL